MKRLMLSAAAAALLAAPATAGAADYTFALVPKNVNNPFFDQARDGCKKAEEELGGAIEAATSVPASTAAAKSSCRWSTT